MESGRRKYGKWKLKFSIAGARLYLAPHVDEETKTKRAGYNPTLAFIFPKNLFHDRQDILVFHQQIFFFPDLDFISRIF